MSLHEDLDRIALQERELVLARFDEGVAWELGKSLRALAHARTLPVVIDVRRFGQPIFYAALPGTSPDNVEWVRRKINVVQRFHISSYTAALREQIKGKSMIESQGLSISDYATHGGAVPLRVAGAGIVGSATVSGLPMRADHELVIEGLCALLGRDYNELKLAAE